MKKLIALIISILLAVELMNIPIEAATTTQIYAGNQLRTLGILQGSGDGGLQLDNTITRAEVATIMVRILTESPVIHSESKIFHDVPTGHWGKNYIQKAYQIGIIHGYPDDSFGPENKITYAEVVAIMVNALRQKENLNPELIWPENYLTKAKELRVIPADSETASEKAITRGEMALIVWDTILVKNK